MKVTIVLKGRIDSEGQQPLQVRINEGNVRTYKATGIKIIPYKIEHGIKKAFQWDGQKVINHPKAKFYNELLDRHKLNATVKKLDGSLNKYPDADFRSYMNKLIDRWDKEKESGTLQQFKTNCEKFLDYAGEIKLSRISLSMLNDFKGYLQKQTYGKNNTPYKHNTIAKAFKNISKLINQAYKEKIIENNPLDLFKKINFTNPEKEYLTPAQIDRIEAFGINPDTPPPLRHVATWFVIGCYTGLRHSDMLQFNRKKHIVNGRLVMTTQKTKEVIGMPLNDKLKELFERVNYEGLKYKNQPYNVHLKTIDEACGIGMNLSAHVSRHSFAVRCADRGIAPEVTARLMGITSLKTLAVYYKITNQRIDAELNKIF